MGDVKEAHCINITSNWAHWIVIIQASASCYRIMMDLNQSDTDLLIIEVNLIKCLSPKVLPPKLI
jgi:hypothetical protein